MPACLHTLNTSVLRDVMLFVTSALADQRVQTGTHRYEDDDDHIAFPFGTGGHSLSDLA